MNTLDEQIEALTAILRAQGTEVGIDRHAPDYVKQAWLNLLLNCPDCKDVIRGNKN